MKAPAAFFPIVFALGAMMLAPEAGAQQGPTAIDKCQTIFHPGSYKLVTDLVSTGGNCLVIAANNVTIDLAGFSISGNGTGAGVSAIGGTSCEASLSGTGRSQISTLRYSLRRLTALSWRDCAFPASAPLPAALG